MALTQTSFKFITVAFLAYVRLAILKNSSELLRSQKYKLISLKMNVFCVHIMVVLMIRARLFISAFFL
jgi:hypothetical protein